MEYTTVTPTEFDALVGLDGWRYVLGAIRATFRLGSFSAAASFVSAVAETADEAEHHPDLDVRYPDRVRVAVTTHAVAGLTTLDVDLARKISTIAAQCGATSEATAAQQVEIAIDTMDADRIRPFWAVVLGYRDDDGVLTDPLRIGPPVWFQQMDERRAQRDRFHIDVTVAHDVAETRIAAALAAGGTLVSDEFARSWWILADADGNEACVCTWHDR